MKCFSNVSKFLGAGALAVTLATVPAVMPASAQTSTNTTVTTTNTPGDNRATDGDWGLMGLLGLFGLFGRRNHKHNETVAYNDPNAVATSTARPK